MYTEFIIIFILLGIVTVVSILNLVLLILIKKDGDGSNKMSSAPFQYLNNYMNQNMGQGQVQGTGSVVFCRNCATQYDATMTRCPKCGTPR